ncbi:hypothetical protein OCEANICA350_11796 [Oceanicaulis sp. 350]|nr:hypothetical protein OCEANICA350_11796 [Oceanicaulis sp. 350]
MGSVFPKAHTRPGVRSSLTLRAAFGLADLRFEAAFQRLRATTSATACVTSWEYAWCRL